MNHFFLFLFLFCLSFSGFARAGASHLVNGCRIFTMDGQNVRTFPGDICLFFPDGSIVSASASSLKKFSKSDEILWEIKGNYHHQLELDENEKHILAMGNLIKDKVRFDTFEVIDLFGKVIHRIVSNEIFAQKTMKPVIQPASEFIFNKTGAKSEAGHFNSFYQIPELKGGLRHPAYLRQGNYVINALSEGVFILSPDLKKVLHHFRINHSHDHQVHDVQVRADGDFLYFNNRGSDGGQLNRYSAVQVQDPEGKLVFSYTSEPREFFYSQSCGGVQDLDGDKIIFSDVLNATYFYSRKNRKLEMAVTGTHRNNDRPWNSPTQRVKAYDLREFLKVRKIN